MQSIRRGLLAVLLPFVFSGLPAVAQERGMVFLVNRTDASYDEWVYDARWSYAISGGAVELIYHYVPYAGEGRFILPVANQYVFHHERVISVWDGVPRLYLEPGKGYDELFAAETELGDIAPMRSGNFLVAERWNTRERGAHLIEFDTKNGRIREYRFPELIDPETNRAIGANHIEMLADQCTLLYTTGTDSFLGNRVFRMNLCTETALPDFASLTPGAYAGTIRQLPNGDVLVANGDAISRLNAQGALVDTYDFPNVTRIALAPDGRSFWAAGVHEGEGILRRYDLATPAHANAAVPLGNPERRSIQIPTETTDLVVVGEWRAALARNGKSRAARH